MKLLINFIFKLLYVLLVIAMVLSALAALWSWEAYWLKWTITLFVILWIWASIERSYAIDAMNRKLEDDREKRGKSKFQSKLDEVMREQQGPGYNGHNEE